MRVTDFKVGEYIQRIAPTKRVGDHSFCGECLRFKGFKNNVIFVQPVGNTFFGDMIFDLDAFDWNDNNWGRYPKRMLDKLKKELLPPAPKEVEKKEIKLPLAVIKINYAGPDSNDIFWIAWSVICAYAAAFGAVFYFLDKSWLVSGLFAVLFVAIMIFRKK